MTTKSGEEPISSEYAIFLFSQSIDLRLGNIHHAHDLFDRDQLFVVASFKQSRGWIENR